MKLKNDLTYKLVVSSLDNKHQWTYHDVVPAQVINRNTYSGFYDKLTGSDVLSMNFLSEFGEDIRAKTNNNIKWYLTIDTYVDGKPHHVASFKSPEHTNIYSAFELVNTVAESIFSNDGPIAHMRWMYAIFELRGDNITQPISSLYTVTYRELEDSYNRNEDNTVEYFELERFLVSPYDNVIQLNEGECTVRVYSADNPDTLLTSGRYIYNNVNTSSREKDNKDEFNRLVDEVVHLIPRLRSKDKVSWVCDFAFSHPDYNFAEEITEPASLPVRVLYGFNSQPQVQNKSLPYRLTLTAKTETNEYVFSFTGVYMEKPSNVLNRFCSIIGYIQDYIIKCEDEGKKPEFLYVSTSTYTQGTFWDLDKRYFYLDDSLNEQIEQFIHTVAPLSNGSFMLDIEGNDTKKINLDTFPNMIEQLHHYFTQEL